MVGMRFDGRVAIVTGAGNGLGRDYALELARRGARVVVNDLGVQVDGSGTDMAAAEKVVTEIAAEGGTAVASYDTVATREGAKAIVDCGLAAFDKIDILINNAGVLRHRPFLEQTEEDLALTLASHLHGTFHVSQQVFGHMVEKGYGRIVFTGSSVGSFGLPWGSAYGAAKGGITGLMNVLAVEGKPHGIACNALLPGAATRMAVSTTEGAVPDHVADMNEAFSAIRGGLTADFVTPMALYLASSDCTVTHSTFSAIGGRYAEVFTGLTEGWQGPLDGAVDPGTIADRLPEITDRSRYIVPDSGVDELRAIARGHAQA